MGHDLPSGKGRRRRAQPLWLAGLLAISICATPTAGAVAAPTAPSTAHQLQVGVPYSSSLPDRRRNYAGRAWLRLPESMGPGDKITIAIETDSEVRLCLAPDVDDFGQLDMEDRCGANGYTGSLVTEDLSAGKYRRTLKWTEAESHGFLLIVGDWSCCARVTTVYSLMAEGIEHYEPDFTAPALIVPEPRITLKRRRAGVNITCPDSEASPPCSGKLTLRTRKKVRLGAKRRKLVLARGTFTADGGQTVVVKLRFTRRALRAVRKHRSARKVRLIAQLQDQAGNKHKRARNLRLAGVQKRRR